MREYQIAIYLRLSKEDEKNRGIFNCGSAAATQIQRAVEKDKALDRKEESNSITMQRALIRKYIAENFVDYKIIEFCDDGYTGTNFVEVR